MEDPQDIRILDLERIFMGGYPWSYAFEVVLRTFIMFLCIILILKIVGKRGVQQLSIFELAIIIGLGSAAGDPMFYHDVPLAFTLMVFAIVLSLYRGITYWSNKSQKVENFMEGRPQCLLRDGELLWDAFEKEDIFHDEFFSKLRLMQVEHLGQVRLAYLEPSGELSLFFFEDPQVKPGLPTYPELFINQTPTLQITQTGSYACARCGHVQQLEAGQAAPCTRCDYKQWIPPCRSLRRS